MYIKKFGEVFDTDETYNVILGTEKNLIESKGLIKCKKSESGHFAIVCNSIAPNGIVSGLRKKEWMKIKD